MFVCLCSRMTFAALAPSHRHSVVHIRFLLGHLVQHSATAYFLTCLPVFQSASLDLHYFPRRLARELCFCSLVFTQAQTYTHTATLTALSHLVFGVLIYSKSISSRLDRVGKCFTLQQCCHGFTCSALQFTIFLHLTSLSLSATNMVIHA